ncbi:MAG: hypothetical protein QM811_30710 [Pirellulales bacterium]
MAITIPGLTPPRSRTVIPEERLFVIPAIDTANIPDLRALSGLRILRVRRATANFNYRIRWCDREPDGTLRSLLPENLKVLIVDEPPYDAGELAALKQAHPRLIVVEVSFPTLADAATFPDISTFEAIPARWWLDAKPETPSSTAP